MEAKLNPRGNFKHDQCIYQFYHFITRSFLYKLADKPNITPPYGIQDNPSGTDETQSKADAAQASK